MAGRLPFLHSLTDYVAFSNEAGGPYYDLDAPVEEWDFHSPVRGVGEQPVLRRGGAVLELEDPTASWNVERPAWHLSPSESAAIRPLAAMGMDEAVDDVYQNRLDTAYGNVASDRDTVGAVVGVGEHFFAPQPSGHYHPDFEKAGVDFLKEVGSGVPPEEAAAWVGGKMLVEGTWHEAWNVSDPLLAGDTKAEKVVNALLSSVGHAPVFGTYRPPNVYEGASDLDRQIAAYDYGVHRADKGTVAGMRAYNELVAARDAERRV
jgi:hypothetical protein